MARVPASEQLPVIVVEGTNQLGLNTPSGDPAGRQLFNELSRGGEAGARPGREPPPPPRVGEPSATDRDAPVVGTVTVSSRRNKKSPSLFAALLALGRIDRIAETMARARTPLEKAKVGQLLEGLQPFELRKLESIRRGRQSQATLAWLISNFPGAGGGGAAASSRAGLLLRLARAAFSIPALLATETSRLIFEGFKLADRRATEIWTTILGQPDRFLPSQPGARPAPQPRGMPNPITDPVTFVEGPTVTAFRAPRPETMPSFGPQPFVFPFTNPEPFAAPMPRAQPDTRTLPNPLVNPATRPTLTPFQGPGLGLRPSYNPFPLTETEPKLKPSDPRCNCPQCDDRKKKPKKRQPRDVCYKGTYYERSKGITKYRREQIPCQQSKSKSRSPQARRTATSSLARLLNTAGAGIFSR
jgi:hypothetical protein